MIAIAVSLSFVTLHYGFNIFMGARIHHASRKNEDKIIHIMEQAPIAQMNPVLTISLLVSSCPLLSFKVPNIRFHLW